MNKLFAKAIGTTGGESKKGAETPANCRGLIAFHVARDHVTAFYLLRVIRKGEGEGID